MTSRSTHAAQIADGLAVLRLLRSAVGQDPIGPEIEDLRKRHRAGTTFVALARELLASETAQRLHGPESPDMPADEAFTRRAITAASGGYPSPLSLALVPTLFGLRRADTLAVLAETPLFRDDPPALPALFAQRRADDPEAYAYWCKHVEATEAPDTTSDLSITLAMPIGDTSAEAAEATLASLLAQTHARWRLVIIGQIVSPWSRDVVARLQGDPRVEIRALPPHETMTAALNQALLSALGPAHAAACLIAPGDRLAPTALQRVAVAFAMPSVQCVYTDEDEHDPLLGRARPRFKARVSPDAMLIGNEIGQLATYRTDFLAQLGGLDATADCRLHDLALRAFRAAPKGMLHLSHVLFHGGDATADWPATTLVTPLPSDGVTISPPAPGWTWPRLRPAETRRPRVSVIIPTRDQADLLREVSSGVLHRTDYPDIELLLVDHASTAPAATALLSDLAQDQRVRVLPFQDAFNFAAMNNLAASQASGAVLVLLNNDIEIHQPGWLAELVGHALRPDVGLVGARLLHRDGTLQHGGIALGPEGRATHLFRGAMRDDPGYCGMLAITRDVAAVTGACMAVRRAVFTEVGGMNEAFPVAWNDIDFCQRIRAAGLRVLWTPHATLIHLEGETRGRDAADPIRQAAFKADRDRYRAIWGAAADHDPFINPNLVATDHELCLAPLRVADLPPSCTARGTIPAPCS